MAPTRVQTQIASITTGASAVTYANFAVGSGANRSLVAEVIWRDNTGVAAPTVSSVVFNTTENFTFRRRAQLVYGTDNYITVEIWTLDNPTNATANVVATLSEVNDNSNALILVISEYTGANNGVGANTGGATGNSNAPSCTFTTGASTSMICGAVCQGDPNGSPYTPGGAAVEILDSYISDTAYWVAEQAATAGADTLAATAGGSYRWSIAAIELLAAAGAGTGQPTQARTWGIPTGSGRHDRPGGWN